MGKPCATDTHNIAHKKYIEGFLDLDQAHERLWLTKRETDGKFCPALELRYRQ